jgi:hypothetical protein
MPAAALLRHHLICQYPLRKWTQHSAICCEGCSKSAGKQHECCSSASPGTALRQWQPADNHQPPGSCPCCQAQHTVCSLYTVVAELGGPPKAEPANSSAWLSTVAPQFVYSPRRLALAAPQRPSRCNDNTNAASIISALLDARRRPLLRDADRILKSVAGNSCSCTGPPTWHTAWWSCGLASLPPLLRQSHASLTATLWLTPAGTCSSPGSTVGRWSSGSIIPGQSARRPLRFTQFLM